MSEIIWLSRFLLPILWSCRRSSRKNNHFLSGFPWVLWPRQSGRTAGGPSSAYWKYACLVPWRQTESGVLAGSEYDDLLTHNQYTTAFSIPDKSSPPQNAWNLRATYSSYSSWDQCYVSEGNLCYQWSPQRRYTLYGASPCTEIRCPSISTNGPLSKGSVCSNG